MEEASNQLSHDWWPDPALRVALGIFLVGIVGPRVTTPLLKFVKPEESEQIAEVLRSIIHSKKSVAVFLKAAEKIAGRCCVAWPDQSEIDEAAASIMDNPRDTLCWIFPGVADYALAEHWVLYSTLQAHRWAVIFDPDEHGTELRDALASGK